MKTLFIFIVILTLATACAPLPALAQPDQPLSDVDQARQTLVTFFDRLTAGDYHGASELYGGSYEELIDMNPEADQTDHSALLELACTINGFQCLKVKEIVQEVQNWPDTFTFTVEFANPDGSLFTLKGCCGAEDEGLAQSRFDFTVMRVPQAGNVLRVQRLPVYVP